MCQCRRHKFDPWVEKIPWRRKWQLTPVCLPEKSNEQRSLVGYSPWGHKELDMTEWAHTHTIFFLLLLLWLWPLSLQPTLTSELLISQSYKFLYLEGLHFQTRKLVLREVKKLEQDHTAQKKLKANFLHRHHVHGDIPEFFLICLHILSSDHA